MLLLRLEVTKGREAEQLEAGAQTRGLFNPVAYGLLRIPYGFLVVGKTAGVLFSFYSFSLLGESTESSIALVTLSSQGNPVRIKLVSGSSMKETDF